MKALENTFEQITPQSKYQLEEIHKHNIAN